MACATAKCSGHEVIFFRHPFIIVFFHRSPGRLCLWLCSFSCRSSVETTLYCFCTSATSTSRVHQNLDDSCRRVHQNLDDSCRNRNAIRLRCSSMHRHRWSSKINDLVYAGLLVSLLFHNR